MSALVIVGEVEELFHPARRLLPIQSLRQCTSVFGALAIVCLAALVIGRFAVHENPPIVVFIGIAMGCVPVLLKVLPSRFTIRATGKIGRKEVIVFVEQTAGRYGYKDKFIKASSVVLSPRLPRLLVWDENTIRIDEGTDSVQITGPIGAIKRLYVATSRAFQQ